MLYQTMVEVQWLCSYDFSSELLIVLKLKNKKVGQLYTHVFQQRQKEET